MLNLQPPIPTTTDHHTNHLLASLYQQLSERAPLTANERFHNMHLLRQDMTWLDKSLEQNMQQSLAQASDKKESYLATLIYVLAGLEDWVLLDYVLQSIDNKKLDAKQMYYKILAMWQLGHNYAALCLAYQSILLYPNDQPLITLYRDINHWVGYYYDGPFADYLDQLKNDTRQPLYLESLGHHHASLFLLQHHDPQIIGLCNLKALYSYADFQGWYQKKQQQKEQLLAIMHREFGLIGFIGVLTSVADARDNSGNVGHEQHRKILAASQMTNIAALSEAKRTEQDNSLEIYYWLAKSYWGHGFIKNALRQAIDLLTNTYPIESIKARVFNYNQRSLRVLLSLGFELDHAAELTTSDKQRDITAFSYRVAANR